MAGHPGQKAAEPGGLAADRPAADAKALVMAYIGQLVSDGQAEWSVGGAGKVELRLMTGEVFLLDDTSVARIA